MGSSAQYEPYEYIDIGGCVQNLDPMSHHTTLHIHYNQPEVVVVENIQCALR